MTQFSNKFKKLCFWPILWSISPIFRAKKIFLENPAPSHTTSYEFLAPCKNLEKVNDAIQRKHPHKRMEGKTEGQSDPILKDPFDYCWGSKKNCTNWNIWKMEIRNIKISFASPGLMFLDYESSFQLILILQACLICKYLVYK